MVSRPCEGGPTTLCVLWWETQSTLGSDKIESMDNPEPSAGPARTSSIHYFSWPSLRSSTRTGPEETAIRYITFWREGFTVEDGELMRYDDPANERILSEINSGYSRLSLSLYVIRPLTILRTGTRPRTS